MTAAKAVGRLPRDVMRARHGEPSAPTTYLLTRRAHVMTEGRSSEALTWVLSRWARAAESIDPGQLDAWRQRWAPESAALTTDGACPVPDAFTADEVGQLRDFATDGPAVLTLADGSTRRGTYRDRTPDVTSVRLDQSFVLTQPSVQAMLARGMAAQITAARVGMWPSVHPPILYWSCVTDDGAGPANPELEQRLARRYHSDFDGLGGTRLHVYLTDVDLGSAPMDYVLGSHLPRAIPRSLRSDVTDDIDEAEVRRRFPDTARHTFTGPAGTSFMSDANGLHRGTRPTTTDRLFLVMPIQAGAWAGAYNRVRRMPIVDDGLALALRSRRPDLRLFEAAPQGSSKVAVLAT
jgi:hypothetical protein